MGDDQQLVAATLRGELDAFGQLVRKYQMPLLASACQLIHHAEDAQDLAQETLLAAYQRLGQLREPERFRPWLFAILRRKCQDYFRMQQREEYSLEACEDIPSTPYAISDGDLPAILARLPYADREILTARYVYELDFPEIAQVLHCSVQAAYKRCTRARERLRTMLLQADEEETRCLLQRATNVLTAGLLSDAFVLRVLQQVRPRALPIATRPPLPHPPILHLPAAPVWLSAAGWKIAVVLVVAGAITGFQFAPRMPAPQAAALLPAPVVQYNSHQSHTSQVSPQTTCEEQLAHTAIKPLLLADAATPANPAPAAPAAQDTPPPVPATTATVPPEMILPVSNATSIKCLAVSPDGKRFVTMDWLNTALLWDMRDGTIIERIPGISSEKVMFSADNRRLLFNGGFDTPPTVWDIAAGHAVTVPTTVPGFGHLTKGILFDNWGSGRCMAEGRYWQYQLVEADKADPYKSRYALNLWDLAGGRLERTVSGLTGQLQDISRDNTRAVTLTGIPRMEHGHLNGTDNMQLIVWDLDTGKEITRLKGLSRLYLATNTARFSPDGNVFAASSGNGGISADPDLLIWDTRSGALLHSLNTPTIPSAGEHPVVSPDMTWINTVAFSSDGTQLASGGQDGHVVVWDVAGGKMLTMFQTEEPGVAQLAYTPDGAQLLSISTIADYIYLSSIQLWDVSTRKLARTYAGTLRPVAYACWYLLPPSAVTPDGKQLAIGAKDHIDVWDLSEGRVRRQLPWSNTTFPPPCMAFNPDGTLLLTAGSEHGEQCFMVWDLASGMEKKTMRASIHEFRPDMTRRVAFSPDGAYAVGCNDHSLVLWDTKDWREIKRIDITPGTLDDVAFSPDGMKLAWFSTLYTGRDGLPDTDQIADWRSVPESQLVVWDIPSGRRDTLSSGAGHYFQGLTFSPDGKWLASRTGGQILLWNLAEGKAGKPVKLPDEWSEPDYMATWREQLTFTVDSTHLLFGEEHLLNIDITTGEVKPTAVNDDTPAHSMALARQGRELITWDVDGTARLWDTAEVLAQPAVKPRATLQTFEKNLWLITTPAGYFDCAPGMSSAIRWKQGEQSYPYERFEKEYHRPEMVRKALAEE